MDKFTYENQGTSTFLVYEIRPEDELDSMSLGMLTNNKIPGFAAASFTQMDTTKYIKYNVSAKVSASQLFSGPVNKKRLIGVFSGIVDAMLSAEDYMLDPQTIILDLEHIFTDVTTCETVLICLPVIKDGQNAVDMGMFFKNIIFRTQFDQTENCDHVAQIINYLNGAPMLSLEDFKAVLDEISQADAPKPVQAKQQPTVTQKVSQPDVQPVAVVSQSGASKAFTQPSVKPAVQEMQYPKQQPVISAEPAVFRQVTNAAPAGTNTPVAQQEEDEKPMTMFYLLQHYNKENAAKYKAQQEAKKAKKSAGNKSQKAPAKAEKASAGMAMPGFAIPGQETQSPKSDFAIPGKQESIVSRQPVQAAQVIQHPVQQTNYQSNPQPISQYVQQPVSAANPISFGETTVLGGQIGETTVLGGGAEPVKENPHLIRVRNSEKIPLNKPVFRIGKEKSYVDYFISDNTAVSRSHANIINRDGEFFVVDTNSTNHTYVNGGMIPSNVETRLSHGTKLRLANEDFEFKLY